jgi:hypothetical protein
LQLERGRSKPGQMGCASSVQSRVVPPTSHNLGNGNLKGQTTGLLKRSSSYLSEKSASPLDPVMADSYDRAKEHYDAGRIEKAAASFRSVESMLEQTRQDPSEYRTLKDYLLACKLFLDRRRASVEAGTAAEDAASAVASVDHMARGGSFRRSSAGRRSREIAQRRSSDRAGRNSRAGFDECDVFISYRASANTTLAVMLYDKLTARGLNVWLDRVCLPEGKSFAQGAGMFDGIRSATVRRPAACALGKSALQAYRPPPADASHARPRPAVFRPAHLACFARGLHRTHGRLCM